MKNESEVNSAATHATTSKALGRLGFISMVVALCLFGTAGTVSWMNGWIFMYNVAAPVLLGSFPALAVGVVFALLMVIRTALEDATLLTELAGYEAYAEKTYWRLLPFVW